MAEVLLVVTSLLAVGIMGLAAIALTPQIMLELGLGCLLGGLLLGIPAGLWYHVQLYRGLARCPPVPRRWWMHPTDLHAALGQEDLGRITPWFRLGGIGFLLSIGGGLAAITGLLLSR